MTGLLGVRRVFSRFDNIGMWRTDRRTELV